MTSPTEFGAGGSDASSSSSAPSWFNRVLGRPEEGPVDNDGGADGELTQDGQEQPSFWSRFTNKNDVDPEADVEDDGSWLSRLSQNPEDALSGIRQGIPWFRAFEEEEPDCWRQMTRALGLPSLSLKQRLYGFGICWFVGFVCAALGSALIFNLNLFAVMYTFANIFNLIGTFFLVGPVKQAREMFDPTRLIAAIVYLSSMGLTLFAALYLRNWVLAICMVAVQSCALIWYLASFVPFARALIRRTLTAVWESITSSL